MADLLVSKGYEVHGIVRRHSLPNYANIQHLLDAEAIRLHEADLGDLGSLENVVEKVRPDEIYNLAAQSHVGASFSQPDHTLDVTGRGAMRVFEAVRRHAKNARVYQASSSEMYGRVLTDRNLDSANENTPFRPCSPYGSAKLLAHSLADVYRKSYGMAISTGILFNHESERRGIQFVTRKITRALARIKFGQQARLELGSLHPVRDWGHAKDYVEIMWLMLLEDEPGDYVIATGVGHTVAEFLQAAWKEAGFVGDAWSDSKARVVRRTYEVRPTDIDRLVGDAGKARRELGWAPKIGFEELVRTMVEHDLELAEHEEVVRREKMANPPK